MKKYFALVAIVMAVAIVGCKNNSDNVNITGKWKIADAKIDMPGMPAELMDMVKKAVLTTTYNFNADSTVVIETDFNENKSKGKWGYISETKTITLDSEGDGSIENELVIISGDDKKMVVKNDKGEEGKIELTLERVEENETH